MALNTASTWAELSSLTNACAETSGTAAGEDFVGAWAGSGCGTPPGWLPGSGSGPEAGGMEGTGGGPPTAWGDVPLPGATAGLGCAGGVAAWTADAVPAPAGDAAGAAAAAGPAGVGAVAVGDPGTGAACGRPDPDGGADAVVVLSAPAVVLEVGGATAAVPAGGSGTARGSEAGAITVRRQAANTATGTAIRLNVSPDSRRATVPKGNSGNGSLCGAL